MPGRAACLGLGSRADGGGLGRAAQAQGQGRVGRGGAKGRQQGTPPPCVSGTLTIFCANLGLVTEFSEQGDWEAKEVNDGPLQAPLGQKNTVY